MGLDLEDGAKIIAIDVPRTRPTNSLYGSCLRNSTLEPRTHTPIIPLALPIIRRYFQLPVSSLSRTLVPPIVHDPPFWAIDPALGRLAFINRGKLISSGVVEGLNNKAKVTMRKSSGFRTYRVLELAIYHSLGKLPVPESTHDFFRRTVILVGSSSNAAACLPNARRAVRPVKLLLHPF
jgi:hypothetical protein